MPTLNTAPIAARHAAAEMAYRSIDRKDIFTDKSILDQNGEYSIHRDRGALLAEVARLRKLL